LSTPPGFWFHQQLYNCQEFQRLIVSLRGGREGGEGKTDVSKGKKFLPSKSRNKICLLLDSVPLSSCTTAADFKLLRKVPKHGYIRVNLKNKICLLLDSVPLSSCTTATDFFKLLRKVSKHGYIWVNLQYTATVTVKGITSILKINIQQWWRKDVNMKSGGQRRETHE